MAWVAFDRAIRTCEKWGREGPGRPLAVDPRRDPRRRLRQRLRPRARLVRPVVRLEAARREPPADPARRLPARRGRARVGTIEAIGRTLARDGLIMRYEADEENIEVDGLPPGEGVVPALLVLVRGRPGAARPHGGGARALHAAARPAQRPGLISEEYDPEADRMLGQLPAGVHPSGARGLRLRPRSRADTSGRVVLRFSGGRSGAPAGAPPAPRQGRRSRAPAGRASRASRTSTFRLRPTRSSFPRASSSGSPRTSGRCCSYTGGGTIRFTCPISSSSSMKTTPFAVAGRWRAIAMPATATSSGRMLGQLRVARPSPAAGAGGGARAGAVRPRGSSSRSRRASAPSRSAAGSSGTGAVGSSGSASWRSPRELRSRARGRRRPARAARVWASRTESQAPAGDERLERGPVHRRAAGEVGDVGVRLPGDDRLGLLLADRADVAEPDPHRAVLVRASGSAQVDVGRQHLHPAPLAVADETGRRVEAHRLRVQQRAEELGRVVVAQPRRLVGEQRERGRVRLREAEPGEAGELVVDRGSRARRRRPVPAPLRRTASAAPRSPPRSACGSSPGAAPPPRRR